DVERVGGLALLDDGFAGIEALQLRHLHELRELVGLERAAQGPLSHGRENLLLQLLGQAESLHLGFLQASTGGTRTISEPKSAGKAAAGYASRTAPERDTRER